MERSQVLEAMGELKLFGMRGAYDKIVATAVKRQHEPQRVIGDLLVAEINEKQARSIKHQMTIAKLPLAKDIDDFDFTDTPVNESLVRELAIGTFVADQRNVVLVGGTGTGKSHLAIAIARALIRNGTRGRAQSCHVGAPLSCRPSHRRPNAAPFRAPLRSGRHLAAKLRRPGGRAARLTGVGPLLCTRSLIRPEFVHIARTRASRRHAGGPASVGSDRRSSLA